MWLYNNKEFTEEDIGDSFGYVYEITNNTNGRKYVGKKFFTRAGTKQIKVAVEYLAGRLESVITINQMMVLIDSLKEDRISK
jgi:hypothetical protein